MLRKQGRGKSLRQPHCVEPHRKIKFCVHVFTSQFKFGFVKKSHSVVKLYSLNVSLACYLSAEGLALQVTF